jgi:hypothetical protein
MHTSVGAAGLGVACRDQVRARRPAQRARPERLVRAAPNLGVEACRWDCVMGTNVIYRCAKGATEAFPQSVGSSANTATQAKD